MHYFFLKLHGVLTFPQNVKQERLQQAFIRIHLSFVFSLFIQQCNFESHLVFFFFNFPVLFYFLWL